MHACSAGVLRRSDIVEEEEEGAAATGTRLSAAGDRMRGRDAHLIGWKGLGKHVGERREAVGA